MTPENLIACHECDLLLRIPAQSGGGVARCGRCNALLHKSIPNSIERSLALSLAGLVLFIIANSFPFLAFKMQGLETETTLVSGVVDLYNQGMWEISLLVLFTTIVVPLLQLLILIYVLLPLYLNRTPWKLGTVFRFFHSLQPWGMMEVFMIGILVAVVKLVGMAQIVPGTALWSFALLIFVLAASSASLDPRLVWNRVGCRR
ncbi:MAG: paraquat-inducible protein A [Gammaproteobacteria bacterium]|nr:MAG: paraquat-inducible protein A [Gammaproteobacteria bacterium]